MKYGMSDRVGLATYGERVPQFLKGVSGWGGERDFSEDTARAIDAEVRELLDRLHDRVRGILTTRKASLVAGAAELKQVETLEGERLRRVLAGDAVERVAGTGSREAGQ
jgi:cell division protease FtsH